MKKSLRMISVAIMLMLMLPAPVIYGQSNRMEHAGWWLRTYETLPQDDPLVPRIHTIFEKVLAAADKRGTHFPQLLIFREAGGHLALCIEDGTVIITKKAIDICYLENEITTGDARIAFVLGHELAHLADGHFPYAGTSGGRVAASPHVYETKEIRADTYGMLYAAMSGHDPKAIVDGNGVNFFRDWETSSGGNTNGHPSAARRLENLIAVFLGIDEGLYLFETGVRLYQMGRYRDARDFLAAFNTKFPCREVYNLLGLVHFQLAMNKLAGCDPETAFRFKPAAVSDTETMARKFDIKVRRACAPDLFRHAARYFRDACDKDPFYTPARINYASVLIMQGQYARAAGLLLDRLPATEKADPKALNNLAVAVYLLGPSPYVNVDMFADASDILKQAIKMKPDYPDALYNLGRIQFERKRISAARESWKKFLEIEPNGIFARAARNESGMGKTVPPGRLRKTRPFPETSPVKLGTFDDETKSQLRACLGVLPASVRRIPDLGTDYCEYYAHNGIRILALGGVVEMVESPVKHTMRAEALDAFGAPRKTHTAYSGKQTRVYNNFAVDIKNGNVIKVVHCPSVR